MKRQTRTLRAFMLAVAATLALLTDASPAWEKVGAVTTELSDAASAESVDVKIVENTIVLTLSHNTNVKLFTILGQLVDEKQLDAGTWRFPLSARGIYILKAGSVTRRITI